MNNKLYSYDKIEESSSKWSSEYKKIKKWGVIEKIHGSNFSFLYDTQMRYAKRTGFIEPSEHFFNYQTNDNESDPTHSLSLSTSCQLMRIRYNR